MRSPDFARSSTIEKNSNLGPRIQDSRSILDDSFEKSTFISSTPRILHNRHFSLQKSRPDDVIRKGGQEIDLNG